MAINTAMRLMAQTAHPPGHSMPYSITTSRAGSGTASRAVKPRQSTISTIDQPSQSPSNVRIQTVLDNRASTKDKAAQTEVQYRGSTERGCHLPRTCLVFVWYSSASSPSVVQETVQPLVCLLRSLCTEVADPALHTGASCWADVDSCCC